MKFLIENSKFTSPDSLDELKLSFYARFIIDSEGKAQNICMLLPSYPDRLSKNEREVLMPISKMPAWKPAERKGKKVAVWFLVPVKINFQ